MCSRSHIRRNCFLFAVFLFFLGLSFCGCRKRLFKKTAIAMGTVCEIKVVGVNEEESEKAIKEAFAEISRIEKSMSLYLEDSDISRMNEAAFRDYVKISEETFGVLKEAREFSRITDGSFDITVSPLVDLWGFYKEKGRIPAEEEIRTARENVGFRNVILKPDTKEVKFAVEGLKIDLGGVAKGYACDAAVDRLKNFGIKNALVNIGGNIYAFGMSEKGRPWTIGIKHPREKGIVDSLRLDDRAVSTSGDYERFFEINGKRYSHIVDPKTGYPARKILSVTVVADSAMKADMFSTAAFVLGPEKIQDLARRVGEIEYYIMFESDAGKIKSLKSGFFR